MHPIIDAAVDLTGHAQALYAAGTRTVIRYYCRSSSWAGKCLTREEADALLAAGLSLAVVFQQRGGAGGHIEDLDAESGERDVLSALDLAGKVGQPHGTAIYFAVDHDFHQAHHLAHIRDYFDGIRAAAGDLYRVGCYGSGLVQEQAHAALRWLPNARAWQGTAEALAAERYELRQRLSESSPLGFSYDPNEARVADFGQWPVVPHERPGGGTQTDSPSTNEPSRDQVRAVQRACRAGGIDPGPIDGILGPLTKAAVARLRALLDVVVS